MKKIKAGIAGAAGYTGGELLRLLNLHPECEIIFAHSKSQAGKKVWEVHSDLVGDVSLDFTSSLERLKEIDVLFLCVGHGEAKKFLEENKEALAHSKGLKIIDLSQDHRLDKNFVYGLPELNRESIVKHSRIANPGCFATAIQLALLPLAKAGLLENEVHISATTGSTGAGQSLSESTHFSWRHGNHSSYKAFEHQHLDEINQTIKSIQPDFKREINFIPNRGGFTRGIIATLYTETSLSDEKANALYQDFYDAAPFVWVSKNMIDVKQVVNTNKCILQIEKHGSKILITSIIDNLLKGASGQAVQNMNLMFGMDETTGLKLKASAF